MFSWRSTASTRRNLCPSMMDSGLGFFLWWGEQGISPDTYWMILQSKQASSSRFSRKTVLSRTTMLKFSWLPRISSLICHFSSSNRQELDSTTSTVPLSLTRVKGLSLDGRGVWASWRPVCQSTRFMSCRWSLTRFSSKLVLRWKLRSRSCTRSSYQSSMRLVRQQVSSSRPTSSSQRAEKRGGAYWCPPGRVGCCCDFILRKRWK